MTVNDLRRLYDYGYWANRQLLAVVSELTPEEFTRSVAGSYGFREEHAGACAERRMGLACSVRRTRTGAALDADDYPNMESLIDAWARVEEWVRTFLVTLKDDDLHRLVAFKNSRVTRGRCHWASCCSTPPITVCITVDRSRCCESARSTCR
jgi:hypothetical protein